MPIDAYLRALRAPRDVLLTHICVQLTLWRETLASLRSTAAHLLVKGCGYRSMTFVLYVYYGTCAVTSAGVSAAVTACAGVYFTILLEQVSKFMWHSCVQIPLQQCTYMQK